MDKYVLVNPFLLSKQFDDGTQQISSTASNFIFQDDILTWKNLTPEIKELPISWDFKKDGDRNQYASYRGSSVIPINWID